ncbi:MAG TPA: energy-coupling factor transporter transmembrane component T [Bacteroidales bacterium]
MRDQIPEFLLRPENRIAPFEQRTGGQSLSFIDITLRKVAVFIKAGYLQGETSMTQGFLQKIDARIKILFLLCFIIEANVIRQLSSQLYMAAFLLIMGLLSWIDLIGHYKKILIFSFFFGLLVVAPAALNLITPGKIFILFIHLKEPKTFWIYHIPSEIGITKEGVLVVIRLYLKVVNSLTVTFLIISTTPFNEIIKALKILRVPDMFLLIITMTYKFIFIMAHTIQETYFALKLRWWKKVKNSEANRIIAGRIAHTFRKSWLKYEEVFKAMLARGFSGKVDFCYLRKLAMIDFAFITIVLAASLIIYLI